MGLVRLLAIAGVCASLALVACGDDDDDAPNTQAEAPAAETTTEEDTGGEQPGGGGGGEGADARSGVEITTADSQFGEALFDGDRAIYYFDKEQTEASECYGDCAVAWPPVLTEDDPQAGGGADAKLLGTIERDDGSTQVTYAGRPLYYYIDDPVGQILCHNVVEFGGTWLAVQPNGDPVA
jgi:predicted lipoprotein with Yx(FWY)xxD motif